jgi:hypothetical protein
MSVKFELALIEFKPRIVNWDEYDFPIFQFFLSSVAYVHEATVPFGPSCRCRSLWQFYQVVNCVSSQIWVKTDGPEFGEARGAPPDWQRYGVGLRPTLKRRCWPPAYRLKDSEIECPLSGQWNQGEIYFFNQTTWPYTKGRINAGLDVSHSAVRCFLLTVLELKWCCAIGDHYWSSHWFSNKQRYLSLVRFISQEVWFDKGFVIWHFLNYCLVQILSLWSLSIESWNHFHQQWISRQQETSNQVHHGLSKTNMKTRRRRPDFLCHRQDLSNKMRRRPDFLTKF